MMKTRLLQMLFVSAKHHKQEVGLLSAELREREERIAELERRVYDVERTRHVFVEEIRYVIEAGGDHVRDSDPVRGDQLKALGHVLPYLLSRRRTWDGPEFPGATESAVMRATQLAAVHGFALPADPIEAVKAMLDLAMALFMPAYSVPLHQLRNRYPLDRGA